MDQLQHNMVVAGTAHLGRADFLRMAGLPHQCRAGWSSADLRPRCCDRGEKCSRAEVAIQLCGGFVETLGTEGWTDRAAPWRGFVQTRQTYCFAKAADWGW
jgi:hypothetical protein